jgi:predicted nucleic acid-binding protein
MQTAANPSLCLNLGRVLDLARAERLTAYDAAYLELAMRLARISQTG